MDRPFAADSPTPPLEADSSDPGTDGNARLELDGHSYRAPLRSRVDSENWSEDELDLAEFPVVGIGASAGGLEALERLFAAMPLDTGMAFVVVQHLSPDFKSVMDELLARRTKIPVHLVEDAMRVEPNRIYLIPPKKEMIISRGRLLLSDKGESQELTLPIDMFFRSLAQDMGQRAIGIVLSGAGSDGARGIRDIHEAGGLVLCQDEASAEFDGMPRSARETGIVDHVLEPTQMARLLSDRVQEPRESSPESVSRSLTGSHGVAAALRFLQRAYGIDFSHYKQSTVVRRIERRLQLTQAESLEAYVERVAKDSDELDALFHDLLIGVTRFFRDEAAFERLGNEIIPELLERASTSDELRVWVAGCATGEEAYSVAILFQEALAKRNDNRRLKILATDVHRGSLDFASRGLYDAERVAGVRPDLLARYFDKRGPNYQVSPELRQLVVFAPHNVVKDAPFTRLDLVSCRNLLIYLQPVAQKRVLSLLHFALKRNGILVLGPSENVGALSDDFETLDTHWRIYRKHRDVRRLSTRVLSSPRVYRAHAENSSVAQGYSLAQIVSVYDALLEEHVPPSLLVNERRELVHAFAGASRYLKHRDGRASLDVLDMLEPELKMAVAGAFQRALKDRTAVVYNGLKLGGPASDKTHRLTAKPVSSGATPLAHVLISIEEIDGAPREVVQASEMDLSQVSRDQLGSLESELQRTKENLQATIEELETSNEELQSANEELLAANEELQSTNEELQSVNEELYTVNAEYQKKIAELVQLTNDMDNLLASIEVGTIFLDVNLRIRKFTPLVAEAFNLLPQDVGRPITAFQHALNHPSLTDDLRTVLTSTRAFEREVQDHHGSWFYLRILPYRARGAVDGVVLTLIDIDSLKAAEDAVFRERYLLNSLMDSVPDTIYFKDGDGRFVRVNRAMAERFGLDDPARAAGKCMAELVPQALGTELDELDRHALDGEAQLYREEQQQHDGRAGWFMTTRQPLRDESGAVVGMFGIARDVTSQKRAENEIRDAIRRRDEFLAMLSHELRNPLAALVNAAALLHYSGPIAPNQANGLAVIERQSRQMTRLLDDLLEVSRITQNKIALKRELLDARDVVEEAWLTTRDKLDAHRIQLTMQLGNEQVPVNADPARLLQVVVNLLDNAAKYSQPGGKVQISLGKVNGEAVLSVRDDGAGIDRAVLEHVFELFVQGRATIHRTEGGMGVGLSVVRSLVEMHGGTITAHSDGPGCGSEFVMRLPLAKSSSPPAPRPRRSTLPNAKRVVVIEDNVDGREMLELLLTQAGYQVFSAGDGAAGLELIDEEKPDIAIVDIGLPRMNGFEIAQALRASGRHEGLYLVALTGYGQPSDHEAALRAGFNEHIVKPLDPAEIERWMKRGED